MRASSRSLRLLSSRSFSGLSGSTKLKSTIKEVLENASSRISSSSATESSVRGWVRSVRMHKNVAFVSLNDGSCFHGIQAVVDRDTAQRLTVGSSVEVRGVVASVPDQPDAAKLEITAHRDGVTVIGESDKDSYPLQKKYHSLDFLREKMHLRLRTNTLGASMRVRNAASEAVHAFFQGEGFIHAATPIVTPLDCEGAGEAFHVVSQKDMEARERSLASASSAASSSSAAAAESTPSSPSPSSPPSSSSEAGSVDKGGKKEKEKKKKKQAEKAEAEKKAMEAAEGDGTFFGRPSYLTVSGQLYAEMCASAFSRVYTFGPTFRAENSHTPRHLAEFWMIEPEVAFADLNDVASLAERMVKHAVSFSINAVPQDFEFFDQRTPGLIQNLQTLCHGDFARMTYTQAIEVLQRSGEKFEFPVEWGLSLQSEHEKFLAQNYCKKPVFVTDYPREIKPFYMRQNEGCAPGKETVACMDLLVPGIGELIGGSQREERYSVLRDRLAALNMSAEQYQWYLDLRRFGTTPHAGFGLGFERLLMMLTAIENARDVIPVPRTASLARF